MAGASVAIDYQFNDQEVIDVFNRLIQFGGDAEAMFYDIGEHLLISTEERYQRQEAPDGTPWEPLSPKYQARKKKNQDLIMVLEGYLRNTYAYDPKPNSLEFGSNRIYAATHQFGDEERGIKERKHIGISMDDETEILLIAQQHLTLAMS